MIWRIITAGLILAACAPVSDPERTKASDLAPESIQSGSVYLTPETQAQQADSFENPGYLWVSNGERLFVAKAPDGPSCLSCHEDRLVGVATQFPKIDPKTGELFNLELQINACRQRHQGAEPLEYESDNLLALTAFVASQSNGMPLQVSIEGKARKLFEAGEQAFYLRRGQMNLSCAQCHNENWGKKLRGDTISQGHGNGFPAYRLEWQTLGSLHRRLHDCNTGVRAQPQPLGDPEYLALELYLAKRAEGLALESPGIRR